MKNILQPSQASLLRNSWGGGLQFYQQPNCQGSISNGKLRLYRPPNVEYASWSTWGGLNLRPFDCEPEALKQYHSYCLMFDVQGFTSYSNSDTYWTCQIGWGGGGLEPAPTTIASNMWLEDGFSGERRLYWAFTINDPIYKVCTDNWDGGHVVGATYLSYRDFKWGFTYQDTGSWGTDIGISNIRLYDITDIPKSKILKNGILDTGAIITYADENNMQFQRFGETRVSDITEY